MRATPNQELPAIYIKKTKWWTELPEGFTCLISSSTGLIFGRGQVILGCLANRLWSPFGRNTKLLCGVKTSPDRSVDLCVLREAYQKLFCAFGDFYASGLLNAEVTISLFDPNLLSLYFYHYHITEEQSSTQFLFLGWLCVGVGGGGGGIGEWGSMVRALDFLSGGPSRSKTQFLESWAYLFCFFLLTEVCHCGCSLCAIVCCCGLSWTIHQSCVFILLSTFTVRCSKATKISQEYGNQTFI